MKMMWTLCLTWSLFYAADALQCQTCRDQTDPQCSNTSLVTCSSPNQLCYSSTLNVTVTTVSFTHVTKTCVPAFQCASLGNWSYSTNLGFWKQFGSVFCCDTDDCNSVTLPVPTQQGNNGLTCFACDNLADENCNKTVQCVGSEDRCVKLIVSVSPGQGAYNIFGCTSANLCGIASDPAAIPQLGMLGTNEVPKACCATDLCNTRNSTATPTTMVPTTMVPTTMVPTTSLGSLLNLSIFPILLGLFTFTQIY